MPTPISELCCSPVLAGPLTPEAADDLAAALKVVADSTRLRLLGLIRTQPGGEACTCDLTEPLGLTQPTVTHHLKVLFEAGFLERERRGRQTYYRIAPGSMTVLCQALDPSPEMLSA
ncbi:metalloregulator ArsR/SmtB family transcription factor [Streptomyces sp. NBC_00335]|uniref:ArsR/SmtB family transcription factor n=1 Tax=unclassified Streptomyces TaxID=2593676 RepID=UPI002256124E|nr:MULTISPECIES: metalloregulator ArsR/SmtB family transcription factor [unclassified Streptomyces]MCX5406643.1 metalloregulator ArsR/SmtB family transcription factor [Streptomyces sp. NBC_00086]